MAFCDRSAPAQQDPPRVRDASGPSADLFTFPATTAMTTQLRTSKGDASVSALPACMYSRTPATSSHTVVSTVQQRGVQQVQAQGQQHSSQQGLHPLLPQEQLRNASSVSSENVQTLGSPAAVAGSTALRSQGGIGGTGQDIIGTGVVPVGGIATASEVGNTVSTATAPANVRGGCPGGSAALFYMRLPLDDKKYVTEQARDEAFRRLRRENRTCFDCASRNPTWLSTTYGVYLCLSCSGKHRRLGTHISFVRSCEMDNFTPEQLLRMELGGNKRAHEFFREHGLDAARAIDYHGKLAARYKQQLDKLVTQEMHAAGWRFPNSATPSGVATAAFVPPAATALQQQQQNMQQQQQQAPQQHQVMLGSAFDVAPSSVAPLAAAPATPGLSHAAGSLQQNSMDCFFSLTGPSPAVTAPAPTPLSFAPSNRINSNRAAAAAPRGGRSASGAAAGGGGVLLSQSNAVTAAPPPVAGTLRARKLDVDFDFEKEIAASTRAGAGAPQHSLQKSDGPQTGGVGVAQQRAGTAADVGATAASSMGGSLTLGPQASVSSSTTAPGGGGGKGALVGVHPDRFTNAKSISSEQYFGSSSTERPAASFAAAVAVDPHKRSISSDEYFGIDNAKNRGKLSVFEDQAVVRLDSLKMAAQQGWATVTSVGTDAMNRAKDWLQGS